MYRIKSQRRDHIKSPYVPPTVESVTGVSDHESATIDPNNADSLTTMATSKRTPRRRHKITADPPKSSPSSAEKERRKAAHRTKARTSFDLRSLPRKQATPRTGSDIREGYTEQSPSRSSRDLHDDFDFSSATSPRFESLIKHGEMQVAKANANAYSDTLSDPSRSVIAPYRLGSNMAASVLSGLSAFSSLTSSSGGSSGSNSTVTQSSTSKASIKTPSTGPSDEVKPVVDKLVCEGICEEECESPVADAKPDVFAYLEAGPGDPELWPVVPRPYSRRKVGEPKSRSSTAGSFHSDSGVSVRGESPERLGDGPTPARSVSPTRVKSVARAVFEPIFARQRDRASTGPQTHLHRQPSNTMLQGRVSYAVDPSPLPQPKGAQLPSPAASEPSGAPLPQRSEHVLRPMGTDIGRNGTSASTTATEAWPRSSSGQQDPIGDQAAVIELLASEFSSASVPSAARRSSVVPVYRRFDTLNHRVLLHLQAEVTELEEELQALDAQAMQRHETPLGTMTRSEIGWRRTELLGRIFIKVGHYNQALASYHRLAQSLTLPREAQVRRYRSWIDRHTTPAQLKAFSRWDGADLGSFESTPQDRFAHMNIIVSVALLSPILAFTIIPSFLARIIIVLITASISGLILLLHGSTADGDTKDERRVMGVCVGVLCFAASVMR
ncbi:MAG: hypothetical protein M1817_004333 [Caeruleum heppii]|nr:MAG: hypothetical protein M1817_004333 [Caeruleum heppii]